MMKHTPTSLFALVLGLTTIALVGCGGGSASSDSSATASDSFFSGQVNGGNLSPVVPSSLPKGDPGFEIRYDVDTGEGTILATIYPSAYQCTSEQALSWSMDFFPLVADLVSNIGQDPDQLQVLHDAVVDLMHAQALNFLIGTDGELIDPPKGGQFSLVLTVAIQWGGQTDAAIAIWGYDPVFSYDSDCPAPESSIDDL